MDNFCSLNCFKCDMSGYPVQPYITHGLPPVFGSSLNCFECDLSGYPVQPYITNGLPPQCSAPSVNCFEFSLTKETLVWEDLVFGSAITTVCPHPFTHMKFDTVSFISYGPEINWC